MTPKVMFRPDWNVKLPKEAVRRHLKDVQKLTTDIYPALKAEIAALVAGGES